MLRRASRLYERLPRRIFVALMTSPLSIGFWKGGKLLSISSGYASQVEQEDRMYAAEKLEVPFSVSKVVVAIVVATLVDKDLLSYDDPVCRYWPGFGKN